MKTLTQTFSLIESVFLVAAFSLSGCIGDDLILDEVDPIVRISNPVDTLALGSTYQFTFLYLNQVGQEEEVENAMWNSDNPNTIQISPEGFAQAIAAGSAVISIVVEQKTRPLVRDTNLVMVGDRTVATNQARSGSLRTTSSYVLQGDFLLSEQAGTLTLSFDEDYEASSSLPGLFLYLTNNPNTINNAFEIGAVEVFKGAHFYELTGIGLHDYSHILYYCKPFRVKVGDGNFKD